MRTSSFAGWGVVSAMVAGWLRLARSNDETSPKHTTIIRGLPGGFARLAGLVLLTATIAVSGYADPIVNETKPQTQTEKDPRQELVSALIRSRGLEETLRNMAAQAKLPVIVDHVTTLATIEAVGSQLRRTYIVDFEGLTMTEEFRTSKRNEICAFPGFDPILRAGGSIREMFVERGGREIGSVTVSRDECGL